MDPNNYNEGLRYSQNGVGLPNGISSSSNAATGYRYGEEQRRQAQAAEEEASRKRFIDSLNAPRATSSYPVVRKPIGPIVYAIVGGMIGSGLGKLALILHPYFGRPGFAPLYSLCFGISFAGVFYAGRQLFRRKWISAGVAVVVAYGLTQILLPGFYLPGILRAMF